MLNSIAEFLGIIGFDIAPPETMGELLPWLFMVLLAFAFLSLVFRFLTDWVRMLFHPRGL